MNKYVYIQNSTPRKQATPRPMSGRIAWGSRWCIFALPLVLLAAGCVHSPEAPSPASPTLPPAITLSAHMPDTIRHEPESLFAMPASTDTVALDALIGAALRTNPDLQGDLAHYAAQLQRIPQETSLPDPSAQVKVSRSRGGAMPGTPLFPPPAVQFPQRTSMPSTTAYTLQAVQPIPWPARLRLQGQIAGEEAAAAFETHNIRLLDIIHDLSRQYYSLSHDYAHLALIRQEKAYVEQFLESALAGYAVGRHGRQPVLMAQTELARLDNELLAFPGRLASRYAALRAHIDDDPLADALHVGQPVTDFDALPLTLPDATPDELLTVAMQLLPEATKIDREIEIGRLAQALAREEYRPDFVAGLEYMNSAAASMNMAASGRRDTVGVIVGITIPVPNARRRAQQAEARLRETEAQHRRRALEINTAAALESAFEQLYSMADRITVYEKTLIPLALDTYETGRVEYETGIGDYISLLDALRTLVRTQQEQLELKRDALLLLVDIQRITGARFVFAEQADNIQASGEEAPHD